MLKSSLKLFIIAFCIISLKTIAQLETSKWYFGSYAALDFSSGSPVPINNSAMPAAGCGAAMADSAGNLLFYSNGSYIWNKNHQVMANGFPVGINGQGYQLALALRQSGSRYYVFTTGSNGFIPISGGSNINYVTVDMSLSSGLGSVTTASYLPVGPSYTRMITNLAATRHCNKTDSWLITHEYGTNAFYTYLINSTSVSATPVVSNIGSVQGTLNVNPILLGASRLKISPNGSKLCYNYTNRTVELYDFDIGNGQLSNCFKIDSNLTTIGQPSLMPEAASMEFSPDGSKLYVRYVNPPYIAQFNLCAGSASAIAASKTIITNSLSIKNAYNSALQLALDGKIYLSRWGADSLDVINNPNASGTACGFTPCAVYLGTMASTSQPAMSAAGLINFESNYFEQKPNLAFASNSVSCGQINFAAPALCAGAGYSVSAYKWLFGDALSGTANTATVANPNHAFSGNGTYSVQLILQYPCGSDTVRQTVSVSGLPVLTTSGRQSICAKESTTLTAAGASTYSWSSGSSGSNVALSPTATTVYTLSGNSGGCVANKAVTVTVLACTDIHAPTSTDFALFPNPARNEISLESTVPLHNASVSITNVLGKEVKTLVLSGDAKIDLSELSNGVYFLVIKNTTGELLYQTKVIKQE